MRPSSKYLDGTLGLAIVATISACSPANPNVDSKSHAESSHSAAMTMIDTGDPDTDFLKAMIPHHQGAIDMARQELAAGSDPQVRQLAKDIIAAQQAEIRQMKAWIAEREQRAKKGTN